MMKITPNNIVHLHKTNLLKILFFPFFLCIACYVDAQQPMRRGQYLLNHLESNDGLSSNRVFSILQTPDYATWISTKHGVDRYNGRNIKNYNLFSTKRYSDAGGREIRLFLASRNRLFAYDNKGKIYHYDSLSDQFLLQVDITLPLNRSIYLNKVCPYKEGDLWMAMNEGLYYLRNGMVSPTMKSARRIVKILPNIRCNDIIGVPEGVAIASDKGLYLYNIQQKKLRSIWSNVAIQSLCYDKTAKELWVGTFHNGLVAFSSHGWKPADKPKLSTVPQNFPIRSIIKKGNNTLLVGIDGGGVYMVSTRNGAASPLFYAEGKQEQSLKDNGIYTIYNDKNGIIWMGSYSGGVTYATTIADVADVIKHEPTDNSSISSDGVNAIMQARNGEIWYATNQGVSIFNPNTHSYRHILKGLVALTLCQTKEGTILIGTYGDGIYSTKGGGSIAKVMSVKQGNLRSNYVYSVFSEHEGDVWAGCLDGDLVHISNGKPRFYPIRYVQQLVKAPDGSITVATSVGLYRIDPLTNRMDYHNLSRAKGISDANNLISSALYINKDVVWLGTDGGGIYEYNLLTNRCKQITTEQGLPSNSILALIKDAHGKVWATTEKGLAMLYPTNTSKAINVNFIRLVQREYNRAAACRLLDNRLVFGSTSGAVVINPAKIIVQSAPSALKITDFRLQHNPNEKDFNREKYHTMLMEGMLSLSHKQNTFDINFESIDYKYQADIVYRYRLEGYDALWSNPDETGEAHYTNVPPGTYTFMVKAISKHDGKEIGSKSIKIVIHEPWYNTIWAWLAYLAIVAVIIYFVWNYYRERLRRRYFNQKMTFFINTAHDIRTPLSLVLAPLNDIAHDRTLSAQSRSYLQIARENGDKLLKMVTQLLDFQRSDRRKETMRVQEFDLQQFLETYYDRFAIMAKQKKISFLFQGLKQAAMVWMDKDMADKMLENLISNAIKYTPEGGNVTVSLTEEGDYYTIKVKDNGIGIPQADQRHVFKNFYRASNAINSQQPGSGLGLMLTQRLAAIHGGKLTFESTEGKGTTFSLMVRKGKQHLLNYIIQEEELPIIEDASAPLFSANTTEIVQEEQEDKNTLLFVDDNEALRNYIRQAFSPYYNVVTAASGEEALDIITQQDCDIVVSDVMMPGMSGTELCAKIKHNKDTAWLPVILLTAKSERNFIIEGLQHGADDYIPKPFDTDVLRTKIDTTLQNRRRLSAYYLQQSIRLTKVNNGDGMEENRTENEKPSKQTSAEDEQFIRKATEVVLKNLSNHDFSINTLCMEMAMSRTLFYGKLKTLTGKTPQDFIRIIRLERAASLLTQGKSVTNAGIATGFVNSKHFATQFKKHFGVPPSKYIP